MVYGPFKWTYDFGDLTELTGLSNNALHQAVSRGKLEPDNLRSLIIWLSRHANPELKRDMLRHALYEDAEYVHNVAKRKSGENQTAKKKTAKKTKASSNSK